MDVLISLFQKHHLRRFWDKFAARGCQVLDDLRHMSDSDLEEIGMGLVHKRAFAAMVAAPCHGSPSEQAASDKTRVMADALKSVPASLHLSSCQGSAAPTPTDDLETEERRLDRLWGILRVSLTGFLQTAKSVRESEGRELVGGCGEGRTGAGFEASGDTQGR